MKPSLSDFEVDQWLFPYPVPTLLISYGQGGMYQTMIDMRGVTGAFQIHEKLISELKDSGDGLPLHDSEINEILSHDLVVSDPYGDCAYFYDEKTGKFNLTSWADFVKFDAPEVEKQAYLRLFEEWNGPAFKRKRIGRFVDRENVTDKILQAYQLRPDWLICYLDQDRLWDERLDNEVFCEEDCWFWRDKTEKVYEWL